MTKNESFAFLLSPNSWKPRKILSCTETEDLLCYNTSCETLTNVELVQTQMIYVDSKRWYYSQRQEWKILKITFIFKFGDIHKFWDGNISRNNTIKKYYTTAGDAENEQKCELVSISTHTVSTAASAGPLILTRQDSIRRRYPCSGAIKCGWYPSACLHFPLKDVFQIATV